jgi:hypothetical protein
MIKAPVFAVASALLVAGCVTVPTGPAVPVMPSPAKTFDQFQADDVVCRQYAQGAIAGAVPGANDRAAASAAAGTLLGAATGAIIGGATGHAGEGAAIGAGAGMLWGAGAANAGYTSYELQRRYDIFYAQCMFSRGHQYPGRVVYRTSQYPPANTPPPVGYAVPAAPARIAPPPSPPASAGQPGNYPPPDTPAPAAAPRSRVLPAPATPAPAYPPPAYPPAGTPPPGTAPPS